MRFKPECAGELRLASHQELLERIETKTAQLVVIGLGYVGLPVAGRFAQVGFKVTGLETNADKVETVNRGGCPIEGREPGLPDLIAEVVTAGKLRATSDYAVCREADVILIAVETPIDSINQPRYTALRSALRALEPHLFLRDAAQSLRDAAQSLRDAAQPKRDVPQLVIVESTVAPGTMHKLVCPTLEVGGRRRAGEDFFLVHCPERVMPGLLLTNLAHMSRVVGGHSSEAAELAQALYRHIVEADLDLTDCVTAELVKTAENAYRDVQIAFANELALICQHVGADVWQVRELVNKSPGRNVLLPGAGVGGHCIPKDPWLLAYGASETVRAKLIPAAREINDYMPLNMAQLAVDALDEAGLEIENAQVAVLGYAYLENSDDTRNTPSRTLVNRLEELGAEVCIHDPYVAHYKTDLAECVRGCDAVVVMVKHDLYQAIELMQLREWIGRSGTQSGGKRPVLVDGRRVFDRSEAQAAGFVFRGVGIGQ
jgi:UDP-N-acetyl-D-mannosaminuronic acid dehydrogenase